MLSIIHSDAWKRFACQDSELFWKNEKFLNLNIHTNFKSMTIALKLFVNPQFLIIIF